MARYLGKIQLEMTPQDLKDARHTTSRSPWHIGRSAGRGDLTSKRRPPTRMQPDPEAVLAQLRDEASQLGIAGLVSLSDEDWDMLPDGSVEFARSVFTQEFSADGDMPQVVLLVATVCQLWADSEPNGRAIGVNDAAVFAEASMVVANRVALVGESSTHRGWCRSWA